MHSAVSGVVPKVVATMTGSDQVSVLTELLPSAPLSSALTGQHLVHCKVCFLSCSAQGSVFLQHYLTELEWYLEAAAA